MSGRQTWQELVASWPADAPGHDELTATISRLARRPLLPDTPAAPELSPEEVVARTWAESRDFATFIRALTLLRRREVRIGRVSDAAASVVTLMHLLREEADADDASPASLLEAFKKLDLKPPSDTFRVRFSMNGIVWDVKLPPHSTASELRRTIAERLTSQRLQEDPDAADVDAPQVRLLVEEKEVDYGKPIPTSANGEVEVVITAASSMDRWSKFLIRVGGLVE
eukprot:gnl/TRDRNA2_/TRDRNA2_46813_c0_seq1.p1 gnl/TRDRNA2_/TRDRNA2_46813_c0~~gnl/TRDRNA2_/TRDRNA2_46813_c0_seq1.p1  ORF type:complete len:226 (-),score=34.35 gnl/TRDRNA2_/TRDRNA2_46813_c0_seq1:127-804(-)